MIVAGLFLQQLGRETQETKRITKYTTERTGIGRSLHQVDLATGKSPLKITSIP